MSARRIGPVVLVCGSRHWTDPGPIKRELERLGPDMVVHGDAPGADSIADAVAEEMEVAIVVCTADWKKHGKAAGPLRNQNMLTWHPDIVIAFTKDLAASKGTADMIGRARKAGIPVEVYSE